MRCRPDESARDRIEAIDFIVRTMRTLNERECHIVFECIGRGRSLQSVAQDLGISRARVGQLRDRSIRKLQRVAKEQIF
jgi:RNA polymerase sigma factor (sigma-70 family)